MSKTLLLVNILGMVTILLVTIWLHWPGCGSDDDCGCTIDCLETVSV